MKILKNPANINMARIFVDPSVSGKWRPIPKPLRHLAKLTVWCLSSGLKGFGLGSREGSREVDLRGRDTAQGLRVSGEVHVNKWGRVEVRERKIPP